MLYLEYDEIAKIYVFGEISCTNCLKPISFNQNHLILQNHFQLDNSYAFIVFTLPISIILRALKNFSGGKLDGKKGAQFLE